MTSTICSQRRFPHKVDFLTKSISLQSQFPHTVNFPTKSTPTLKHSTRKRETGALFSHAPRTLRPPNRFRQAQHTQKIDTVKKQRTVKGRETGGRGVRCGVWGVECGVWSVGCGVWGVSCAVWGVGCEVWGVGCGLWVVGCEDWELRFGV